MVVAEAVVFWIAVAVLFRRDMGAIASHTFRGGWKLGVAVAGLFLAQASVVLYVSGRTTLQMATLILSQVILLGIVVLNRHLPGAIFFALGIVLNITVMAANGGWMPITPEVYHFIHPGRVVEVEARPPSSKGILLPKSDTYLWVLSDIVPIVLPWRRTAVSIGDLLVIAGIGQFIVHATARTPERLPQPAACVSAGPFFTPGAQRRIADMQSPGTHHEADT